MVNCSFIICSETDVQDKESNKISLINLIDDISASSFPLLVARISIVAFFIKENADPDEYHFSFELSNNGKNLITHSAKIDFKGKNKTRAIIKMGGLLLPAPGIAEFKIVDGERGVLKSYQIDLNVREKVDIAAKA